MISYEQRDTCYNLSEITFAIRGTDFRRASEKSAAEYVDGLASHDLMARTRKATDPVLRQDGFLMARPVRSAVDLSGDLNAGLSRFTRD